MSTVAIAVRTNTSSSGVLAGSSSHEAAPQITAQYARAVRAFHRGHRARFVELRVAARIGRIYEAVFWADNLLDEHIANVDAVLNLFNQTSYHPFISAP